MTGVVYLWYNTLIMTKFFTALVFSIGLTTLFAGEGERQKTDSEVWNEGVDCYRAGDATNALATLRPLMLSRTHGPRAAEVVAKLEYDAARKPGGTNDLEHLEEAAVAAQIALRSAPDDARLNRNFSLAVADIPELRETKRVNAVLEGAANRNPVELLKSAVADSRKLMTSVDAMKTLATNDAEKAVAMADDHGARAAKLADTWLVLKEAVCQSVTNAAESAEISQRVDELRKKTEDASRKLADMDASVKYELADIEDNFTRFYKLSLPPPQAIAETILNQSNACMNVAAECARSWQGESLDYTRAFRARFPEWAKNYEQAAQADTNKPPFTAEAQAKIADLATRLEKLQLECVEKSDIATQRKALDMAVEISELLPKDDNSDNKNQNQNQNQNQNRNQNKNDGKNKNNQQPQQGDDPGQDDDNKDDGEDENKDDKSAAPEESPEDKEIEAVLKRAQERSDEHEAEKKARMRGVRLPPNERDW